jgi:phosphatidylinositol alpha-mannosyltransferase
VFPSKAGESFGIVLVEAMSAGAGVTIGGNNPGYISVLHEWQEAIFDPTNKQEFADILTKFLENDVKRYKIGKNQKSKVIKYDINIVVDELENEYRNMLKLANNTQKVDN